MPILTCIFFTFNWLTMTSEMHFVKFHPEVALCLLSRGKRKNAPLGMRLLWKYIRNYFLVYQLTSHFCHISKTTIYKEFEAEIVDLQLEKYGLSFDIKKCTTSGWALGDENVISIRSFKVDSYIGKVHFALNSMRRELSYICCSVKLFFVELILILRLRWSQYRNYLMTTRSKYAYIHIIFVWHGNSWRQAWNSVHIKTPPF